MRQLSRIVTAILIFLVSPIVGTRAKHSIRFNGLGAAADQHHRRVPSSRRSTSGPDRNRHVVGLRGRRGRHTGVAGNADRHARRPRPLLAPARCLTSRRHPGRRLRLQSRAVARHPVRASRRSRRPARPSDQRAVCDPRRRRRHARWTAGVRLCWSRPTPGTSDQPRRGTVRMPRWQLRPTCCPARPGLSSPSTSTPPTSAPPPSSRAGGLVGRRHRHPVRQPARPLHQHQWRHAPGFAVQNLGNTNTSYSGMLFYDQNNALGQFQGFNNVTHEYRINNIARVTPGGAFNGSINFMLGGSVEVSRRAQRQHRHRHHRAVGAPRSQQCGARRAREHVDDQFHELCRALLPGEAIAEARPARPRPCRR